VFAAAEFTVNPPRYPTFVDDTLIVSAAVTADKSTTAASIAFHIKFTVSMLAIVAVALVAVNVMFIVSPSPVLVSTIASVAAIVADVAVIVSPTEVMSAPEIVSVEVVNAKDTGVTTGVTVVVVSVVVVSVVVVVLSEPQAANDRAIKETPPARAAFAFFFSQTAANFSASLDCLVEASISV